MKIGFIGGSGHHYLRRLLSEPDQADSTFAVAGDGHDAVASRNFAETLRLIRPDVRWYDNGVELLEKFAPDVVSVGAVYGYLGDWNAEALRRDIAVISDKPVAATWQQYDRLRELVADSSRVLLTEFDFRSRRDFRAARDAVAAGKVGDIVLVTAQKSYKFGTRPPWYARRASYPGTLMWIASHGLDAVGFVAGQQVTRVIGHQSNISRPDMGEMEDHVGVLMQLANGGTAMVHADFCQPAGALTHGDDRLRVVGSRGIIQIINDRCTLTTSDSPPVDITEQATVEPIHRELMAAALGTASPYYSTALTMAAAELLLKARDSADQQSWVTI